MRNWILAPLLALSFSCWAVAIWVSGFSILSVGLYDSIFSSLNPLFWLSLVLAVAIFFAGLLHRGNSSAGSLSVCAILLILGITPYLIDLGQTYDSYAYYGFSLFVAHSGHIPAPQPGSTLIYFEWPGFFLLGAALLQVTGMSAEVLVKSFPFVNLMLFGAGIFTMIRTVFQDGQEARLSVLVVFLASTLTFYDFSPNWNTFSIGPLFIASLFRRNMAWRIASTTLFCYITLAHPFNGAILVLIVTSMYLGQRVLARRSYRSLPRSVLSYLIIYLAWTVFVGTFVVSYGFRALSEAIVAGGAVMRITSLAAHFHVSEYLRRVMIVLVTLGIVWIVFVKRSHRDMDQERSLCWPTGVMLGLTLIVVYAIQEPFFWGRTYAYTMLLGLPVVAAILRRIASGATAKHIQTRKAVITALLIFFLLTSYVLSAENSVEFGVPLPYMRASQFLEPSIHKGGIVMAYPVSDVYSVLGDKLMQVSVSVLTDEALAHSKSVDFIIVRKRVTIWYSYLNPDIGAIQQRVHQYAELNMNRFYDNGHSQIYQNP